MTKVLIIFLAVIAVLGTGGWTYLQHEKFGPSLDAVRSAEVLASNQTLWVSFALVSDRRRLFFSGDSGYGPHFAEIGERFGGFDMAALDSGQYNPSSMGLASIVG